MTFRLDALARNALRPDEVVVVDWHVTGLCCADSGEFSVRALRRGRLPRRFRPVDALPHNIVYAHPTAWAHLAKRDVAVSCRRAGPLRWFTTDLPPDAGLRACLGRLPPLNA
ncbi:hypothetical protein [Saccharothrix deserti]|uniref:hypothetical protein n=1 Tax=Saccharothrix deserti TaxID=2593674 RepID=UPI00131CA750|nr:hypothetical protein [Saccharothrix deserti]